MAEHFAFTARYWGDGAVVCRAIQDRPGPIVEQQFGKFPTWTQAQNFATKLNEGLDLDPLEVRRIVTSSFLATADVIHEALDFRHTWTGSTIRREAREAQLRSILSQLSFAITLCRTTYLLSESASLIALKNAHRALDAATRFIPFLDGDDSQLETVLRQTRQLQEALQSPPPTMTRPIG